MSANGISRRHFFFGSLLAGLVPAGGFGSVPSLKRLGYTSPNEKLNIASIGAGGRAATDIAGVGSENIVAFADVNAVRAAPTYERYQSASKYTDFRRMLDKEERNVDAVTIVIPDFMHATAALDAIERGKHVYVEKPLTHTPWEARMLTQAAAKYKVATQMGNQGYSFEGSRIASEIIWSGEIGNVTEVHAWTSRPLNTWPQGMTEIPQQESVPNTLDWDSWLGIKPVRPYTSGGAAYGELQRTKYNINTPYGFYEPFNWRGFYEFGCGPIGDIACHLLGAANMALLPGAPSSVELVKAEGKNDLSYPTCSIVRYQFPARGTMPALTIYWYDAQTGPAYWPKDISRDEPLIGGTGSFGGNGVLSPGLGFGAGPLGASGNSGAARGGNGGAARATGGYGGGPAGSTGCVFVGDKGFMTTDTYGANVRLLPLARHNSYKLPAELLTRSPGHYQDWIRACKGGDKSCSDFSVSGPFTEWVLLSTIAMRVGGKLEWDTNKMEFTNNKEANKYVRPEFRKSWAQVWAGKELGRV